MSAVEITPTGSEPLSRMLTQDGAPLTGATVRCDVRRSSDGLVLDFADSTFKAVGAVGTRYRTLTAVDAVEWPGLYQGTALDLSTIVGGVSVGTVLVVTYYTTAPSALTLDQDSLTVVNWATPTNITAGTITTVGTVTALGADAITSAALAASAVTEIQTGLALEATLTAMKGATFDTATDSLEALRNRGDAAWITATGFATPTNVSDAQAAVLAKLPAALVGGRIDASVGAMQADVLTASALAASAVTEVQSGLATSAALATAQADITTIVGRVDVASSTLATSAALAAVATDATKSRRALWNRRALTSLGVFTLYADDAVTPLATATVTDKDGAAITLATGDAARTTALA